MEVKKLFIFISLLFYFLPTATLSVNHLDVIINEIVWMRTNTSYNDE